MSPMASLRSITNSTDVSPLPSSASDRHSNIINIFFGLTAIVSSVIMIWQARRMWKSWLDRPNTEVYELATHDNYRYELFAASPTSLQEFGGSEFPMGPWDQYPHSPSLDADDDTT